jgi:hypothetical protein
MHPSLDNLKKLFREKVSKPANKSHHTTHLLGLDSRSTRASLTVKPNLQSLFPVKTFSAHTSNVGHSMTIPQMHPRSFGTTILENLSGGVSALALPN